MREGKNLPTYQRVADNGTFIAGQGGINIFEREELPFLQSNHGTISLTCKFNSPILSIYDSIATVGEIQVWWRADFQSGSRVLKKVF